MPERYKREIEEILRQAGELGTGTSTERSRPGFLRLVRLHATNSLGGKTWSISPGRVMLLAIALLLSSLIVRPFLGGLTPLLAWGGLLLFIVGYAMFFVRPTKVEKRWRGEKIEYDQNTWWDRFRRKSR